MNIRLLASIVLLCGALPAIAAKPTLPATPIRTSQPAEIILVQQELAAEVPGTADAVGMQFGLIGALVGTAVSNAQVKNAEERVGELRNVLLDYPFNARMEETLQRKLAEHAILGDQGITVLHATWDGDSASMANPVEDALVLVPGYAILSSFEQLSVKVALSHVQRTARAGKKPKQKILFTRNYAFNFPLSTLAGDGADESAARWVAFGRQPLEALLDTGIDQVTDMLVYDLSTEGRDEAEQPIRGMSGTVGGQEFKGRVVREGDRWLWLRSGPGALRTLTGQHPVDETIVAAMPVAAAPASPAEVGSDTPAPARDPAPDDVAPPPAEQPRAGEDIGETVPVSAEEDATIDPVMDTPAETPDEPGQ
ncbi:hypothetical protein FZO89_09005 [Luteimonas viscosa]|uniref:Uncharacterized protein n=1 Tax=Luteimonas viscosa TaxID=1132694 RepID=A0A5D4XR00_9GAMM|nr:hypothetical protein [Luteimonas viscosa]TYT26385.1 hypothetical protein FZO89_09005 [Luteimonas viscosa]